MKRFFISTLILGSLFWIHPLFGLFLGLIYAFYLDGLYYELVFFGIIIDTVYATLIPIGPLDVPLYTVFMLVVLIVLGKVKKYINIHV